MKKEWTDKEKEGYILTGREDAPVSEMRVYRYISYPLAKLVAKTPITANMVTWMGLLSYVAMTFTLAMGTWPFLILSAVLIQLANIFDFMDGLVARLKNQSSIFGAWFDPVAHQLGFFALFFGMAWGVSANPPVYFVDIIQGYGINFGIFVWILAFVCLYNFLSMMQLKGAYVKIRRKKTEGKYNLKQGKEWGIIRHILINKQFVMNFFSIGFLVNQMFAFLLFFGVYSSLFFLAMLANYGWKLKKVDRKPEPLK